MKCLVTGGSGFFGELLCKELLEKGFEVTNFDLNQNTDEDSRVKYIKGDIRNFDIVRNACENMEYVFHNVAQVPLAKDKDLFETVNKHGTENILKAALEAGVKKLVYTSSSAVFGVPKENPVLETTLPVPREAYGKAKYDGEVLCEKYSKKGLDISIVRPRTILGNGRLGIFQILFEWIYTGQNVPVFNTGNNIYQFVHAKDLAGLCIKSAFRKGFEFYNCGAEEFGSMRELLQALCDHAATGSKVRSIPSWPAVLGMRITSFLGISPLGSYHALMYGKSMYFDVTKAKSKLDWSSEYSNEKMIIESYDWYVENRDFVLKNKKGSHHKKGVRQGVLKIVGKLL